MNLPLRLAPVPATEEAAAGVRRKLRTEFRWMAVLAAIALGIGLTQALVRSAPTAMPLLAAAAIIGAMAAYRANLERIAVQVWVDHVFTPRELEIRYRVGPRAVVERFFLRRSDIEGAEPVDGGLHLGLRASGGYRIPAEAFAGSGDLEAAQSWGGQSEPA